jgi:hypothetical protein
VDGRFNFRFSFNARGNVTEGGFAFESILGSLEYSMPVWGTCSSVGISLSREDALALWTPGGTYNWIAFMIVDGHEIESPIQSFAFTLPCT